MDPLTHSPTVATVTRLAKYWKDGCDWRADEVLPLPIHGLFHYPLSGLIAQTLLLQRQRSAKGSNIMKWTYMVQTTAHKSSTSHTHPPHFLLLLLLLHPTPTPHSSFKVGPAPASKSARSSAFSPHLPHSMHMYFTS